MCPDNAAPGNSAGARCMCGGGEGGRGRLLSNKQEPLVTPVPLSPRLLRCVSGGGSI